MKKKLFLFMFMLAVFSIPVYAEMPDDTLEVLEEGLCSEGVPYEVDGSIALPSSYNLRSLGMVTSVKDQGDKPYCLTYARIAALESALIKKGYENASVDLSEVSMLYEDWVNSGSSSPFGVWCEYSGCETIGSANSFDNQFHLRNFPVYEYQMPMRFFISKTKIIRDL